MYIRDQARENEPSEAQNTPYHKRLNILTMCSIQCFYVHSLSYISPLLNYSLRVKISL